MLRVTVRVLGFTFAFVLTVWLLVSAHTFLSDVPLEPLLGTGGITVLLCVYFGIASFAAGVSLSLEGIDLRHTVGIAFCDLAFLVVAIEVFIFVAPRLERTADVATLLLVAILNAVTIVLSFRLSLASADRSARERRISE